jgi:hypothetical protein
MTSKRRFENSGIRLHERYQLLLDMSGLLKKLHLDPTGFQRKYGTTSGQVEHVQNDTWVHIEREDLLLFANLAKLHHRKGDYEFIQVLRDPVWSTFRLPTSGYTGRDRVSLDTGDLSMLTRFQEAGASMLHASAVQEVSTAIKTTNVIIIGSPKSCPEAEQCLQLIWPNGEAPLRFFWNDWFPDRPPSRFTKPHDTDKGVEYSFGNQFGKATDSSDYPAGALVIRRLPVDGKRKQQVTTILIAGCSRKGTERATDDLLSGAIFVPPDDLEDGKPTVFVLGHTPRSSRWFNVTAEVNKIARERKKRKNRSAIVRPVSRPK